MVEFAVTRDRSPHPRFRQHTPEAVTLASDPTRIAQTPTSGLTWANGYRARLRWSDGLIVTLAVGAAFFVRFGVTDVTAYTSPVASRFATMSLLVILVWSATISVFRSRDLLVIGVGTGEYRRVAHATTTTFGLLAIAFLVFQAETARWFFTIAFPLGLVGLLLSRWMWRQWLTTQRTFGHFLSRVIVVGSRVDVEKVVRQIRSNTGAAYTVVGAVVENADSTNARELFSDLAVSSDLGGVAQFARTLGVDGVVVAGQPSGGSEYIHDLAWHLEGGRTELILATCLANVAGPRIHFRPVEGLPLIHVEIPQFDGGKHLVKRVMDVTLAGLALLFLSPVFAMLAVLIRLDSEGSALFSQERVGRDGRIFRIYKFRSMVSAAPELLADLIANSEVNGVLFKMKNDPRVTRVGRTLRKFSLDELPQLWNVLRGDMSLVGPRPPLPKEVSTYEDHVHRRLYIKPGLTGMWQVNGRSNLSWEESVRLDLYYVENWSLLGDLIILWRTVKVVTQPVGAY
ncbi:MAG: polyprenyl glycosylphosphotransferase [Microbacteriaceae bacterium]|nr:polyprenyl glycosylphosphotransferase [Microbacteriaceae bacterium]